ncbi:MAG: YkgJ family cysteine cluster protein [Euryarchaeota archaeon]|nr:YkgJ family cysteine cluster protein [Euryarchaeota archaeon]
MAADWEKTPCFINQCSKCCRQTEMPLLISDITRLEAAGHDSSSFSIVLPDGSVRLANSPATQACVFLKTESPDLHAPGTCQAWDSRPEGCRIYPLVLDELDEPFLDELCPHRDQFPPPPVGLKGRLLVLAQTLDGETR